LQEKAGAELPLDYNGGVEQAWKIGVESEFTLKADGLQKNALVVLIVEEISLREDE